MLIHSSCTGYLQKDHPGLCCMIVIIPACRGYSHKNEKQNEGTGAADLLPVRAQTVRFHFQVAASRLPHTHSCMTIHWWTIPRNIFFMVRIAAPFSE